MLRFIVRTRGGFVVRLCLLLRCACIGGLLTSSCTRASCIRAGSGPCRATGSLCRLAEVSTAGLLVLLGGIATSRFALLDIAPYAGSLCNILCRFVHNAKSPETAWGQLQMTRPALVISHSTVGPFHVLGWAHRQVHWLNCISASLGLALLLI